MNGSRSEGERAVDASPTGEGWGAAEAWMVLLASEFVLMLGGLVVVGRSSDPSIASQFFAMIPFWAFTLVATRVVVTRAGGDPLVELGLRIRPIDLPIGLVVGAAMQLLVIPLIYWPLLKVVHADNDELERVAQRLGDSARGGLGTVLLIVMTCLAAPVVEEILYRGLLMGALSRRHRLAGLVLSAAVFAALHFQPLQFAGLFVFGLVLGGLVLWTGRVGTSIVTHMAFNATTVVALLMRR